MPQSQWSSVLTPIIASQVETLKAERDVIESELKSATIDMKTTFLSALSKDGAIDEPNLSTENIGKCYGNLTSQVRDSLARQEALIKDIQVHDYNFYLPGQVISNAVDNN